MNLSWQVKKLKTLLVHLYRFRYFSAEQRKQNNNLPPHPRQRRTVSFLFIAAVADYHNYSPFLLCQWCPPGNRNLAKTKEDAIFWIGELASMSLIWHSNSIFYATTLDSSRFTGPSPPLEEYLTSLHIATAELFLPPFPIRLDNTFPKFIALFLHHVNVLCSTNTLS